MKRKRIDINCRNVLFSSFNSFKVPPSPVPNGAKAGNYVQYYELLDRHKQKMVDVERNMDEWNKMNQVPKASPYVQVLQRPVANNNRPVSA